MGSCPHCGGTPTDHVDCCLAYGNAPQRREAKKIADLEQQVADARTESAALLTAVREIEAGCSCELVTIGAYCERFGDKPIAVHPDRLDGIWSAIKARAEGAMKWAAGALDARARCEQLDAANASLAQQVAALEDALEWASLCLVVGYKPTGKIREQIDAALRAAGRKT